MTQEEISEVLPRSANTELADRAAHLLTISLKKWRDWEDVARCLDADWGSLADAVANDPRFIEKTFYNPHRSVIALRERAGKVKGV